MSTLKTSRKYVDTVSTSGGVYLIDPPEQFEDDFDFCFIDGDAIAIEDQLVVSHFPCGLPGGEPHCAATMSNKSDYVFIAEQGVVRKGDDASCGHTVATGSDIVFSD